MSASEESSNKKITIEAFYSFRDLKPDTSEMKENQIFFICCIPQRKREREREREKKPENCKLIFFFILCILCMFEWNLHGRKRKTSQRMSAAQRANERSARAKRPVRSKRMSEWCERMSEWCERMSEWCERTSERTSEWSSTLSVDFVSFQPRAHRYETFFVSMVEEILFFTT